jgi:secondary thiamine-phosphate synthase enzyme
MQSALTIQTKGRGPIDITGDISGAVSVWGKVTGVAHVFLQHTSASLLIQENADPNVFHDIESWLGRIAPDNDPRYRHIEEGPDDMSAHLRTMLTSTSLTIPVTEGRLALGVWQGVFLYEHRAGPHNRHLMLTLLTGSPSHR